MVQYTAMSTKARAQVINSVETDDPEVAARQRHLVQLLLAKHPEFGQDLRKKGRREGRRKGRIEGEARALLTVLRGRGIAVPDAARDRILAEKDPARLERWLEKAGTVATVAELLDEPS